MRSVDCTIFIETEPLSDQEKTELVVFFDEYGICNFGAGKYLQILLQFAYDDSDGTFIDPFAYRMVELFLRSLAVRFPNLRAEARCRYAPRKENLEKGYDDFGGFREFRLMDGFVYQGETAIV